MAAAVVRASGRRRRVGVSLAHFPAPPNLFGGLGSSSETPASSSGQDRPRRRSQGGGGGTVFRRTREVHVGQPS